MGILELVKEHLLEEAKQEGIEKGIEKGIKKGIEEGLVEGKKAGLSEGEKKKARTVIQRIIKKYPDMTDKEIAEIVVVPVAFVREVRKSATKPDGKS